MKNIIHILKQLLIVGIITFSIFDMTAIKAEAIKLDNPKISTLYVNTFGNKENTPIIFLHGGPGYNCAAFEFTAAQKLSEQNYFVIVYDRRGEGRSEDANAKHSFAEAVNDVKSIQEHFGLGKVNLIGHSFGGMLAVKFAEKYPELTQIIILVGAPIYLQESFKHIIQKSKLIYEEKSDNNNLRYVAMLEKMDTTTMQYASYCFMHAMQNGFYSPKVPTEDAKEIYKLFSLNPTLKLYSSNMTQYPPATFAKNDNYTNINLKDNISNLIKNDTKIYGIYGKEDGLYSAIQVEELQSILGEKNLVYYENCSHNSFVDQQKMFIDDINNWLK